MEQIRLDPKKESFRVRIEYERSDAFWNGALFGLLVGAFLPLLVFMIFS